MSALTDKNGSGSLLAKLMTDPITPSDDAQQKIFFKKSKTSERVSSYRDYSLCNIWRAKIF